MKDKSLHVKPVIGSLLEHNLNQRISHFRSFNQGCGSGSGGSVPFYVEAEAAKFLPLPLPHRLFDLESNSAKKFCPFLNVDLSGEVAL